MVLAVDLPVVGERPGERLGGQTIGGSEADGLAGDAIPISARLMAMADVFDALISRRVYKEAFPFASVRNIIAEERGRLFDPDIADAFLTNCGEFEAIALHFGIER